ncbi:hypothetical protein [Gordonia amicalis]|uniref:hypothetical protein n=1 Tax=Gordonia amicalis TaxID=89053 RepID=UPI0024BB3126|nr:hypothetical protein [Gordonia amicalis]MDJ0454433.1 hypothetical protein [Gordonia amicalis]MDV7077678.1 hypothetical protein [Gordonia amicalis]
MKPPTWLVLARIEIAESDDRMTKALLHHQWARWLALTVTAAVGLMAVQIVTVSSRNHDDVGVGIGICAALAVVASLIYLTMLWSVKK